MKIIFQVLGFILISGIWTVFIILTFVPMFLDFKKEQQNKEEQEKE